MEPTIGAAIDLTEFAGARSGGDSDQIRAFCTDDAVIMLIRVDDVQDGSLAGAWGIAGYDID